MAIGNKVNEEFKVGKVFGRLTITGEVFGKRSPVKLKYFVPVECSCANKTKLTVRCDVLRRGTTKSCSCWRKENFEAIRVDNRTHQETGIRLYRTWSNMKRRCHNPDYHDYYGYGDRGIKVCDLWRNSYIAFRDWAINNGYDEKLTIDRIDNDGNYEPTNCRWATRKVQDNNKRNNIRITLFDVTFTLSQWYESGICPVRYHVAYQRIKRDKWIAEQAVLQPNKDKKMTDEYLLHRIKTVDSLLEDFELDNELKLSESQWAGFKNLIIKYSFDLLKSQSSIQQALSLIGDECRQELPLAA